MFVLVVFITAVRKNKLGHQKALVANHGRMPIKNEATVQEVPEGRQRELHGIQARRGELCRPAFCSEEILRERTGWWGNMQIKRA